MPNELARRAHRSAWKEEVDDDNDAAAEGDGSGDGFDVRRVVVVFGSVVGNPFHRLYDALANVVVVVVVVLVTAVGAAAFERE
jgi:hypothetical protein